MNQLAIDLFCGLGGWTDGLIAEGWNVIGFDIEQHVYGEHRYPAQLVLQDVLTIHGSQFKDADLIVASPPCQAYSYMAMPWSRAKRMAHEYRTGVRDRAQLTALFDARHDHNRHQALLTLQDAQGQGGMFHEKHQRTGWFQRLVS